MQKSRLVLTKVIKYLNVAVHLYFVVAKEVEQVYRALKKGKVNEDNLVVMLTSALNTKNIEVVESLAALVFSPSNNITEHTKEEFSKRLYKRGYTYLLPIDYFKKLRNNPSMLE